MTRYVTREANEGRLVLPRGFTWRAVLVGAVLSCFLNIACPYSVLIMQVAGLTSDYITAGAIMLFFVLLAGVNPLLKLLAPRWAFSSTELILIYVMMIVGCAIPTWGLVTNLFHILTLPFYRATAENRWAELFHDYIPAWLAPRNPEIAKFFYEGVPAGTPIPWGAWIVPMFWWISFMLAIYCMMIALGVIFRKQWVENEKLPFPLVQPAQEMLAGNDSQVLPPLFTNRLMWISFAIAFALVSTSGLNHYFPTIPEIPFIQRYYVFRRTVRLMVFWNFAIIGLTYFLSLDVAASIWVFHLLSRIQTGVFSVTGFALKGRKAALTASSAATGHQGMGAMIVLVAVVVWASRRHLRDVIRTAFSKPSEDDAGEILSYRGALLAMALGLVYALGWLRASGLSVPMAAAFLASAFCIMFALTRIIAQGGVGFTASQMLPQPFVAYTFGTQALGTSGLTSLAFTYSYSAEMRTTVMTSSMNAVRIVSDVRRSTRRVFVAMLVAIFAGLAGAIAITVYLNYTYGGANMRMFGVPRIAFNFLDYHIRNPVDIDILKGRWLFTGIGAAVMGLLVFMRHRFVWWPVHYLGFPISDGWLMTWAWWGVFLGWLAKLFIVKLGGGAWYLKLKPLFLGMILGQLMCGAFWMVVDVITGEVGNVVFIGVR